MSGLHFTITYCPSRSLKTRVIYFLCMVKWAGRHTLLGAHPLPLNMPSFDVLIFCWTLYFRARHGHFSVGKGGSLEPLDITYYLNQ